MSTNKIRPIFRSDSFQFFAEVQLELDAFENYIIITRNNVDKEIEKQVEKYNYHRRESGNDLVNVFIDITNDLITSNTKILFYNSLLVSLYSFLERKMYKLCKIAEKDQKIKILDFSGDGIVRYKKYLKKVIDIDFEKVNSEWSEITKLNKLRNQIVHNPSAEIKICKGNEKLINSIKSINGLIIKEKDSIMRYYIKDEKLLVRFLSIIKILLNELYYFNP